MVDSKPPLLGVLLAMLLQMIMFPFFCGIFCENYVIFLILFFLFLNGTSKSIGLVQKKWNELNMILHNFQSVTFLLEKNACFLFTIFTWLYLFQNSPLKILHCFGKQFFSHVHSLVHKSKKLLSLIHISEPTRPY